MVQTYPGLPHVVELIRQASSTRREYAQLIVNMSFVIEIAQSFVITRKEAVVGPYKKQAVLKKELTNLMSAYIFHFAKF